MYISPTTNCYILPNSYNKTSNTKCRNDTIVNSSNMAERVFFLKITPSDHFFSYRVKFKSIPEIWVSANVGVLDSADQCDHGAPDPPGPLPHPFDRPTVCPWCLPRGALPGRVRKPSGREWLHRQGVVMLETSSPGGALPHRPPKRPPCRLASV